MAYRIPNKHPLDLNQRVAVGVSIPFSNQYSVFNLTYTTLDQIKSNIINYILTNTGERVLNPNFGANIRAQLFEQINPNTLNALEIKLTNDIKTYFPSVRINQLTLTPVYEENAIQLFIDYSVLNNDAQTINIIL
jgi:phage baseplate assembly protein W